jgi:DNA topoisomerase-1
VVTAFLTSFFRHYVEYDFTAQLEEQLDDISAGRAKWKAVLGDFWTDFAKAVGETKDLTITAVIDALDEDLGPHFFPAPADGTDGGPEGGAEPRKCPGCDGGRLGLKLGKFGAFIGCSNYPECKFTRKLTVGGGDDDESDAALAAGPIALGIDAESGEAVTIRKGPYGPYIQLGEAPDKDAPKVANAKAKAKPKRVSIPKGVDPLAIDLEMARGLLALPREVGLHPESGKPINAGIGRFGPYVESEKKYASIPADEDVLAIGLNRAVDLLASAKSKGPGRNAGKEIGTHPDDGKPVTLHSGRYGPYVKHGRINATVPAAVDPEQMTFEDALALIAAKAAKGPATKKTKAKAKAKPKAKAKTKSGRAGAKTKTKAPAADASSGA